MILVAAGGVNDGRSVASALMLGASGVWVGTRFIVAKESKASEVWKAEYVVMPLLLVTVWGFQTLWTDCEKGDQGGL